jgi:phage tail sheath gpL-like
MRYVTLAGIRAGQAATWTWSENDETLKLGGSTTKNNPDGTVKMVDFATTYKTNAAGTADDTYRFAAWLGNWQTKLYSLDVMLGSAPFIDAVVIKDTDVAGVDYAISPKVLKGYVIDLIDGMWVPLALTKDRAAVVAGIVCEINATNPGRIDLMIPDVFAAGLRIIAGKINWSFYAPAVAA